MQLDQLRRREFITLLGGRALISKFWYKVRDEETSLL
jgi:hypothetical protein